METEPNLEPNPESDLELSTDPDPNLQIISDPAGSGSGCTTLPICNNVRLRSQNGWCKRYSLWLKRIIVQYLKIDAVVKTVLYKIAFALNNIFVVIIPVILTRLLFL
jgi:hypothetical protein